MADPPDYPSSSERLTASRPRALALRARLLRAGPQGMALRELLELLFGRGPTVGRAHRLIRRRGIRGLAGMGLRDWADTGLGPASAARLHAAVELGRRIWSAVDQERPRLSGPRDVLGHVRNLTRARKESLVGLYLDAQNRLVHRETISVGSLNTTRTHPREILYPALVRLALGYILVHNHPSGCLEPSAEDVEFTRAVRRASELVGIELYDHVIVSRRGWVSLRERGLL